MEYCAALKMNTLRLHSTTWMSLLNIFLSKRTQETSRIRSMKTGKAHVCLYLFFYFFIFLFFYGYYLFIYLFLAVLSLRFCARAFSSCGKRGPLLITVRGPLTITASPVAEHRLQTRRLSNCGARAQPLHGTWDLPRPGLEPVSPALAGRLPPTAPPGKPSHVCL